MCIGEAKKQENTPKYVVLLETKAALTVNILKHSTESTLKQCQRSPFIFHYIVVELIEATS